MKRAARRGVTLLLLACLLASGVLGSSVASAPITAWGSGSLLASRAVFESLPASRVLQDLVGLATGATPGAGSPLAGLVSEEALAQGRPRAVVVFVSPAADVGAAAGTQLQALAGAAGSWVQLPNAVHQGQGCHVFNGLQPVAKAVRLQVLGSCTAQPALIPATSEAIRQHLTADAAEGAAPSVVVICAQGAPEEEGRLLAEAQAAVAAATDNFLMVHTVGGEGAGGAQAQQRRRLLQAEGGGSNKYTTCDAKCRTQVKWLEAFIVFVTIALALSVGTCCMHAINTPTRFETPKDQRTGPHHD